jgi:three-Cys-motif partner protein
MVVSAQKFGGSWTQQKLGILRKYLNAYTIALSDQPYELVYIDAFAGCGYIEQDKIRIPLFDDEIQLETDEYLEGSARLALGIDLPFQRYIFIEQNRSRCEALETVRHHFHNLSNQIEIHPDEANSRLQRICSETNWSRKRAVLFLDPFGMAVDWTTIEYIAKTKAIDMWYLFPLGVAVNRLLKKDGRIEDACRDRLNRIFGTKDWHNEFYKVCPQADLFDTFDSTKKIANCERIGRYFIERLQEEFPCVQQNPAILCSRTNNPLYMLCFAIANPSLAAQKLAMKIAKHLVGQCRSKL